MNNKVDVICGNELTTFPNRKTAIHFFYTCISYSDGSERDRYTNVYLGLTGSKRKMVHDEDYFSEPYIIRVGTFNGNHCSTVESLPKAMTYNEYLKYKKDKELQNTNQDKYYILSIRLNGEQIKNFENNGYYCYDIQHNGIYDDDSVIVKNAIYNHIGSIITTKDLQLNKNNPYIKLDDFTKNSIEMSYQEFSKIIQEEKEYEINY